MLALGRACHVEDYTCRYLASYCKSGLRRRQVSQREAWKDLMGLSKGRVLLAQWESLPSPSGSVLEAGTQHSISLGHCGPLARS
jgi:hypothetical protein